MSDRSIFLYLEKDGADSQCGSCYLWVENKKRCYIHGPEVKITAGMACCYYLKGNPIRGEGRLIPKAKVTPDESGLVNRQVRCENCKWFDGKGTCGFFAELNGKAGLKLDTKVARKGCCNAQEPRSERQERRERLENEAL